MFLSDIDKCTPGHTCETCGAVATEAVEVESEYGGRWWETYCKAHAEDRQDQLQAEYDAEKEEEKKELGFCPFCGYSKDRHAADCFDFLDGVTLRIEGNHAAAEKALEKEDALLALARRFIPSLTE
jgi:hypothetical protein